MTVQLAGDKILSIADDLVTNAKKSGADHAEVVLVKSTDSSIDIRNGDIENSEYSDSMSVGVRVLIGQKSATVSGSDLSPASLDALVSRAMSIAKYVPEDKYAAIAPVEQLEKNPNYELGCLETEFPSFGCAC